MPLTTINLAKELAISYQPLLLAEIVLKDATILRLSSENLDSTDGGVQYAGHDWKPRIKTQQLGAIQQVSDQGIVQSPSISLVLADADKQLWTQWELPDFKGFKGAKLTLKFVYWDADSSTFSSNEKTIFVGICDPSEPDPLTLTIRANNILNFTRDSFPKVRIGRHCPWVFPLTAADRDAALNDEDSDFWHCGYSVDISGGVGNLDGSSNPFTTCDYTFDGCIERLGNVALPTRSSSGPVQIEQDQAGHPTARFGGVRWDPPGTWGGRAYISGTKDEGINQANEAKFTDYFSQIYGKSFVDPVVLNVVGDPNSTRCEVAVCVGQIHDNRATVGPIQAVIVNDYVIPHVSEAPSNLKNILRWEWVSTGDRVGHVNKDAIYDGMGDPYGGGIAVLEIVFPKSVGDSNTVPNVRVLTAGPKIRVWESDLTTIDRVATSNNAWVLADMLTWSRLTAVDLDLQTFFDAAAYCTPAVTYTDLTGNTSATHERFKCGLAIRQRRSSADLIQKFLAGFRGYLVPNAGKIQLFIRTTLADQQPATIAGSNTTTPIVSANANGTAANGYAAYRFDDSNIKLDDRGMPTLHINQRPASDCPNVLSLQFQDEDYSYAADALTQVDAGDVARTAYEIPGAIAAEGITNWDQARRIVQGQFAEQYRGNPRSGAGGLNDSGGTFIAEFKTTSKAVHLRVGQLIQLNSTLYGISDQLFRIQAITLSSNAEEWTIRAHWWEDDWALDTYGQDPSPRLQQQRRNRLLRGPFGWLPNAQAPHDQDPIFDPTEKSFKLSQAYEAAADQTVIAKLRISGKQPVNDFSKKLAPPYAPQATAAVTGGTVPAATYYLALCAVDSDGKFTGPSGPIAKAVVASGTAGVITLPNIYWHEGTAGYRLYAGHDPNKLSLQVSGTGTPSSIDISAYNAAAEGMPDIMYDHLWIRFKKVWHSGVFGWTVTAMTSTTVTLGGLAFTADEWAGRVFSITGQPNTEDDLPIWDFPVLSNTADTLTIDAVGGVTADLVALGVKIGDVVIMRAIADAGLTDDTHIGDAKFVNTVDYFDVPITITDASNATPIVLELATAHSYITGDTVLVSDVMGNTAANGRWTVTIPTSIDPRYNQTHVMLDTSVGNGDFESGGTVTMVTNGLRVGEEKNRLVRIIAGKGRGLVRRIIDNTTTQITIDGTWGVEIPDATSIFIIEADTWLDGKETTPSPNSDPTKDVDVEFTIDNFLEQTLWVQAFTLSSDGRQSIDEASPGREIYVFGGPGSASPQFDKATFGIAIIQNAVVANDVCPHYIVRRAGTPVNAEIRVKIPPLGADLIIDIIQTRPGTGGFSASIFDTALLTVPAGSTDTQLLAVFAANIHLQENDILTADVTQIGSTQPGKIITVVIKWKID